MFSFTLKVQIIRMRQLFLFSFCFTNQILTAQAVAPVQLFQEIQEMHVEKNFDIKYQNALNQIKRVYPLALQAKSYLMEFEKDLADIEKKRKQRRYGKVAHKKLKNEFIYDIRDLYIGEGIMLMKLVHRETGSTISEIVSKYRGNLHSNAYESLGKIWEQDLNIKDEPDGEDWITEVVIQDIIAKRIDFNWDVTPLNKEEFRVSQKEYKAKYREYKKIKRKTKKAGNKIKKKRSN
jgi:hypothetical protein